MKRWDADSCKEAVAAYINTNGKAPTASDMNTANGLPNVITFKKHVGIPLGQYARSVANTKPADKTVTRRRRWTKESCFDALETFIQVSDRCPVPGDMTAANNLPSYATFVKATSCTPRKYYLSRNAGAKMNDTDVFALQLLSWISAKMQCTNVEFKDNTITISYANGEKCDYVV